MQCRQEQPARDFVLEKGVFSQEYFVYFKKKQRIAGEKDPADAAAGIARSSPNKKTCPSNICWDRSNIPAVPPGLTQTRPLCPYDHTAALFTECLSPSHIGQRRCLPIALRSPFTRSCLHRDLSCRDSLCQPWVGYLLFINGLKFNFSLFYASAPDSSRIV